MKTHRNPKAHRYGPKRQQRYEATGRQRHTHRQQQSDQPEHSRQRRHIHAHRHVQDHHEGHRHGHGEGQDYEHGRDQGQGRGHGHHEQDHEHECHGSPNGRGYKRFRHHDAPEHSQHDGHGEHSEHGKRRGRGCQRNLPLTSAELGITLRSIAKKHDYLASRGPHAGDGNPSELVMAMARGDVATVSLAEDICQQMIDWLEEQATHVEDAVLSESIQSLASQLRDAAERKQHPLSA